MYTFLPKFLKTIFWEFDLATLDPAIHKTFIAERILEKGKIDSLKWLMENYSLKDIKNVIESSHNISTSTRNFWSQYLKYAPYNS